MQTVARTYTFVNSNAPADYWEYENAVLKWGYVLNGRARAG